MSLELDFRLARGALRIDAKLTVTGKATIALVGPNGAGKSSILSAVAGLLAIDEGHIALDGTTWDRGDERTMLAAELREVGFVFQDHRLFPHLDARDNVAFALRCKGVPKQSARATAEAWLQRVGLQGHERSLPAQLSGGESQRDFSVAGVSSGDRRGAQTGASQVSA